MPDDVCVVQDPQGPATYEITIQGRLARRWEAWFDGMSITTDADGNTRLTGHVVDQAALFGLLRRVRDLGKPLLAVSRLESK